MWPETDFDMSKSSILPWGIKGMVRYVEKRFQVKFLWKHYSSGVPMNTCHNSFLLEKYPSCFGRARFELNLADNKWVNGVENEVGFSLVSFFIPFPRVPHQTETISILRYQTEHNQQILMIDFSMQTKKSTFDSSGVPYFFLEEIFIDAYVSQQMLTSIDQNMALNISSYRQRGKYISIL